jgi:iron complex outermembrane recepter protein
VPGHRGPFFCSKIQRDNFGTLWLSNDAFIQATNFNAGKLATAGIDLGVDYRLKVEGAGAVDFSMLGTLLRKLEIEPIVGAGSYDCAGLYGSTCGTPSPKWRHKFRTTWTTPWDFSLAATWRYIGAVDKETTSSNKFLTGGVSELDKTFKAVNYIDIAGSYNLTKNVTARLSINNLFDKDPPLSNTGAPFGNGNTYPVVYDALGRRFSFNVAATF